MTLRTLEAYCLARFTGIVTHIGIYLLAKVLGEALSKILRTWKAYYLARIYGYSDPLGHLIAC